jgi:hypothetical protein
MGLSLREHEHGAHIVCLSWLLSLRKRMVSVANLFVVNEKCHHRSGVHERAPIPMVRRLACPTSAYNAILRNI